MASISFKQGDSVIICIENRDQSNQAWNSVTGRVVRPGVLDGNIWVLCRHPLDPDMPAVERCFRRHALIKFCGEPDV